MFTEINDKYYLNEMSMTVLMADAVRDYVCPQEHIITSPKLNQKHAENVVEAFKKNWRRPRDGSNKDLHDMYRSVPDAIQWAADRELERRADAAQADRYKKLLDTVFNGEVREVELYDYDDEDLF